MSSNKKASYLDNVTSRKSKSPKRGRLADMHALYHAIQKREAAKVEVNAASSRLGRKLGEMAHILKGIALESRMRAHEKRRADAKEAAAKRPKWKWTLETSAKDDGDYIVCPVLDAHLPVPPLPIYDSNEEAIVYYGTSSPSGERPIFSRFGTTGRDFAPCDHNVANIDLSGSKCKVAQLFIPATRYRELWVCLVFESLVTKRQAIAAAEEFFRQPAEAAYVKCLVDADLQHAVPVNAMVNRGCALGALTIVDDIRSEPEMGLNAYVLELTAI